MIVKTDRLIKECDDIIKIIEAMPDIITNGLNEVLKRIVEIQKQILDELHEIQK